MAEPSENGGFAHHDHGRLTRGHGYFDIGQRLGLFSTVPDKRFRRVSQL